jgi:hypothetical protein
MSTFAIHVASSTDIAPQEWSNTTHSRTTGDSNRFHHICELQRWTDLWEARIQWRFYQFDLAGLFCSERMVSVTFQEQHVVEAFLAGVAE